MTYGDANYKTDMTKTDTNVKTDMIYRDVSYKNTSQMTTNMIFMLQQVQKYIVTRKMREK